jgi:hypothetical protein
MMCTVTCMVVASMTDQLKLSKTMMKITSIIVLLLPVLAAAQIDFPPASPDASWTHQLGFTQIELTYSRPQMRGRKIFGSLVPYHEIWRTGAGESTRITFSDDIKLGGESIKKGKYALYSIPGPEEWIIILNEDATLHGDFGYDEKKDALRFKVTPQKSPETFESFTIELTDFTADYSATLQLSWENSIINIPVESNADTRIMAQIEEQVLNKNSDNPSLLHKAAQYYYTQRKDLNQALVWSKQSEALKPENFDYTFLSVKILEALNRIPDALLTAEKAIETGMQQNRTEEVLILRQKISTWKKNRK